LIRFLVNWRCVYRPIASDNLQKAMTDSTLSPFLESGNVDRAVLIGAPDDFDFTAGLENASSIRLAVAFGHMSGWNEVSASVTTSAAARIQVLLGQAYFQTEPALILALKHLQEAATATRSFEVKLASSVATFHPKLWIIEHDTDPFGIVGSGNLSRGGLLRNVECGLFTNRASDLAALNRWFDLQWAAAPPLSRTYEEYIRNYQAISGLRKNLNAKIDAATSAQADKEAKWRHRLALQLAAEYWRSDAGRQEVEAREEALSSMRSLLNHPKFQFGVDEWKSFLRIPELGRIRLGHEKKTIADLPKLKGILLKLATSTSPAVSVEALQTVSGVGRNLATKLLAMHRPDRFVVINEPVESALRAFGYDLDMGNGLTGAAYNRFLKDLAPFIEECEAAGLRPAAALDAFFYDYRDKQFADGS
jgi:HKD family nuclease